MKIPIYQPTLSGNEKLYVNECLDTSWISSRGRFVNEFEAKFAEYIGIKNAIAVFNGTVAIHLALVTLGIGAGDEVIVPTFTYIASANPILQVGAKPVFVDSLESTWQMDPEDIERKITENTKAIIAVHLYGHPCDMDAIMKIAKKHNLFVVEDCAEAVGTEFNGKKVGSFGDINTFSFFGNKTITTGEGGMLTTNDPDLAQRAAHFKGQGLAKYREYWHDTIGFNYRMTNIQAAIGLAQLEQVEKFIGMKQAVAAKYQQKLAGLPVKFHSPVGNVRHTFWMCSIMCESEKIRDELRDFLKQHEIETRPTFFPIHTMPVYANKYEKHSVATNIALRGINLPSFPTLSDEQINFVCSKICEFFVK